jgi:hypothetical protein
MTDQPVVHHVSRAQLFEEVWNEPMRVLAPKYGLSDVGLAKLCRRESVPLPPMGYWAKKARKRRRPILPTAPAGHSETIRIESSQFRRVDVNAELPEDIAVLVSKVRESEIGVPSTYPRDYPLFQPWDALHRQRSGSLSDRRPALPDLEKRRRRILYTLSREIEKRGGHFTAIDEHRFKIDFDKDDAEFNLKEPSNRVQRPATPDELRWYPGRTTVPDLRPSGKLRLIVETYFDRPFQRSWVDLDDRPLEGRIREVIVGVLIALAESRRRRLHWEDWHRQRALEEQRRIAAEERRREELAKIQRLKDDAASWFEANRIRQYAAAAMKAARRRGVSGPEIKAWATAARNVADLLDPLSPSVSAASEVLDPM